MKKQLLAVAVTALAVTTAAFAQANDTLAKIKSSGAVTLGVCESLFGLRGYTPGSRGDCWFPHRRW